MILQQLHKGTFIAILLSLLVGSGVYSSLVTHPPYYDDWCRANCNSHESCIELFQENYVDLQFKVKYLAGDGTGRHLTSKFYGLPVSRQNFETQCLLDLAKSLGTSPCRIYVLDVKGFAGHFDSGSVLISLRLFPADANDVAVLTKMVQEPHSPLYDGEVTRAVVPLHGLVAPQWDGTIQLGYSISIVGGDDVVIDSLHGKYLNQGALQACSGQTNVQESEYCQFERHLRRDMALALGLEEAQFVVLFVKEADLQSVVVTFRIVPIGSFGGGGQDEQWVKTKLADLSAQSVDPQSLLFTGNVSYKINPNWGVSGESKRPRAFTQYLSRPAPDTPTDTYERCKSTHRCPRARIEYNQTFASSVYTAQEYAGGTSNHVGLFMDFEDWRKGSRGWEQSCRASGTGECLPASNQDKSKPRGAHWSPFDFGVLGPSVLTYDQSWNNGLVLNRVELSKDVAKQTKMIDKYKELAEWTEAQYHHGLTDGPRLRFRENIKQDARQFVSRLESMIEKEQSTLDVLAASQCINTECSLLFNTSDFTLRGAVNATGMMATTPDGTEVAVWPFASIDLDQHVNVTVIGQRALALVSRSSVRINTTFHASPGTLGGFPGGFSVSRRAADRFVGVCSDDVRERDFLDSCPGDQPVGELSKDIVSNNINGPGEDLFGFVSEQLFLLLIIEFPTLCARLAVRSCVPSDNSNRCPSCE